VSGGTIHVQILWASLLLVFSANAASAPMMNLATYEASKFELAEILRATLSLAGNQQPLLHDAARELFARLAADRFNLLVAGRFSRGKSSLMNAVLGSAKLSTGLLPVTSVITSVEYANPEALYVEFQDSGVRFEVPMQRLAEYTTEQGNPGNEKGVHIAHVGLTCQILRRGFSFVDSPGLGSSIAQNTRTTEAFLPEADAVILVTGYDGPLSEEEIRVLQLLEDARRRLFVVLNKQDTVSMQDRKDGCQYVAERLHRWWRGPPPQIFSLSALQGLAAKMAEDPEGLEASGLAQFEHELLRFLVQEKGGEFLRSTAERVRQQFAGLKISPEVTRLQQRLDVFTEDPSGAVSDPHVREDIRAREGQAWAGCELCTAVHQRLFEFLCHYQHQLASVPEAALGLAEAGGLCAAHLRLYTSLASERDICAVLVPLISRYGRRLEEHGGSSDLRQAGSCRLCELQREVESKTVLTWQDQSSGPEPAAAANAHWLCLPHLRNVLPELKAQLGAELLASHANALARLSEDMQRYILKRDGTRNGLTTADETQAAGRAVAFLAGARTLVDVKKLLL
jgi:GTP-binding protein EngB required for normal cell division